MEEIQIPTEIDTPHQFLLWSSDEFIPFCTFLVIGQMMDRLFMGIAIGAGISWLYKRFKNSKPDGYLNHAFLYRFGFAKFKGLTWINPFKRFFRP
jgi:conjugal transfer pilus assembly protein TraL